MFLQQLVGLFLLSPPFAMIGTEIAVLANSMRVVRPINVGTLVSWLFPASRVVAVLAHPFCVKLEVGVRTGGHEFLDLWLSLLIRQLALKHTSFPPPNEFCTQTAIKFSRLLGLR